MPPAPLLATTDDGLSCAAGDFHVDPWRPVPRAVVTHAHADHARRGCGASLAAAEGAGVLRVRMGAEATIEAGIPLPPTHYAAVAATADYPRALVVAPPLGRRLPLVPAVRLRLVRVRLRLDADPRRPPPSRR